MGRWCLILYFLLIGCSTDKEETANTLQSAIGNMETVLDNVIACAASNENDGLVSVFLYPRNGVSNIQYYETASADVDKNDFSVYNLGNAPLFDVFNGYLLRFEVEVLAEKWVIVSFNENGKIHLSNPIRLKQIAKPTEYLPQNISVDKTEVTIPVFSWQDGTYDDTKIYFQVVSDAENNFLSGTYTFEKTFAYYQLDNVVLNITRDDPPELQTNTIYSFTLLSVSEDNWVNQFSEIDFEID